MQQVVLVREWGEDAFHACVIAWERQGYRSRLDSYRTTPEMNPETGYITHLHSIEMFRTEERMTDALAILRVQEQADQMDAAAARLMRVAEAEKELTLQADMLSAAELCKQMARLARHEAVMRTAEMKQPEAQAAQERSIRLSPPTPRQREASDDTE